MILSRGLRTGRSSVYPGWQTLLALLTFLLLVPFIGPLSALFQERSDVWLHMRRTVLPAYAADTLILSAGVLGLTALFGTLPAWLVSRYEFPLRKWLEKGLVYPLAVPAYLSAYAYAGLFSYQGPVHRLVSFLHPAGTVPPPAIAGMPGLILVMASALYPYVYLIMRSTFRTHITTALEAAQTLGDGPFRQFFRLVLPLTRPALAAGLGIVFMELLNEYGAVVYYGRNTLSSGVFRAWFGFYDLQAARRLGGLILVLVFLVLGAETWSRRRRGYRRQGFKLRELERIPLPFLSGLAALAAAFVPLLLGLVLPGAQLLIWFFREWSGANWKPVWEGLANTLMLGLAGSIILTVAGVFLSYARWITKNKLLKNFSQLALLGYSVPGAVIALGVMPLFPLLGLSGNRPFFAAGAVMLLLYAYLVRFISLSQRPVSSVIDHQLARIDEASRSLGKSPLKTLIAVHWPGLKSTLLPAAIMGFLEIIKELPLTMILRPFNFSTLSTRSFELASNEMLQEASLPAVILIILGIGGVSLILHRGKSL